MTANASPAVLAPVDVAAVLSILLTSARVLRQVGADRSIVEQAEDARAAVEQMDADLAAAREEVQAARTTAQFWKDNHLAGNAEIDTLRQRAEAAEADAAIGRVVWRYIDRMNDVCESDPAEKILADFVAAVGPAIDAALQEPRNG